MDHAEDLDIVMPIYNLMKHSDNYSKALESLCQYYSDEPALTDDDALQNLPGNSNL